MLGRVPGTTESDNKGPFLSVVGAGPVGLAVAWRCAQAGLRVTVHDGAAAGSTSDGAGASDRLGAYEVAAGMLSPVAEAYFGERELTALLVASAARWPAFAAELTAATGLDLGHRTEGTLVLGLTGDDLAEAGRLRAYQQSLGLPIAPLLPSELREREPSLAPRIRGGAFAPDDHQVDPRRLVVALRRAAELAGVRFVPTGVRDLAELAGTPTVVAAGCGSAALTGLPVRPVKGQILRLRAPGGATPVVRHVIRGYADGESVYLVPRIDGEVVVGATVEERPDTTVTAGAVLRLLRAAVDLVPELAEYDLVEARAGLRPGTPDNAPLIGALPGRPGVYVATGHHRHGIVLAPITAELICGLVTADLSDVRPTATGGPDPSAVEEPARLLATVTPDRFGAGRRASDRPGTGGPDPDQPTEV